MEVNPLVLVSCVQCWRLHEPVAVETVNPLCPQCAATARRAQQLPAIVRPFGR
jgi:hypothetical protein